MSHKVPGREGDLQVLLFLKSRVRKFSIPLYPTILDFQNSAMLLIKTTQPGLEGFKNSYVFLDFGFLANS
jgi:hypothetical protein